MSIPRLDDLRLPHTLGRYRLVERIGRGSLGVVYRAELQGPVGYRDQVALKIAEPAVAKADPERLLAMADEASLLARVRHPHIVQLRGFEELEHPSLGPLAALVLEFVDGTTVNKLWGVARMQGAPLELMAVLDLADQLLAALEHMHGARDGAGRPLDLVHRDLKPENLMVDRSGALRLLDFGIAWAVEKRVQTAVGLTKGTPPWMSPEQITGKPLDRRSDLFVVGMLLFELLSSAQYVERPRVPRALVTLLRAVVTTGFSGRRSALMDGLETHHGLRGTGASGIAGVLGRLLDADPDRRPGSATAARELMSAAARHAGWSPGAGRAAWAHRVGVVISLDRPDVDVSVRTTDGLPTVE